jgi:two-component system response regulator GlrR
MPPLWQGLYFGLARLALDPQLESGILTTETCQKAWSALDLLGKEHNVPEHRRLLGIAERARRATRALGQLRGHSTASRELKRQIWTACFGADLQKLIVYEPLLQEHNVLILGPTGSGKELVAQVLLAASSGMWVETKQDGLQWQPHRTEALNLAEFPRELMSAQIVGFKRGSYTGAVQDFQGVLSRCHQGVVFLDEIGELPMEGQVVLLRALETKTVRPLGAASTEDANCRVIAATHTPIDFPEQCPDFRRDLFYRLAGSVIRVPPLTQRREDILPIALGFLDAWGLKEQASLHLEDPRDKLLQWLRHPTYESYDWPGNVRELKRATAQILIGDTPVHQTQTPQTESVAFPVMTSMTSPHSVIPSEVTQGEWTMEEMRLWYINHILSLVDGHQKEAAKRLKIHRTTIYHAVKKQSPESDT